MMTWPVLNIFKMVQNRAGFVRSALWEIILSLIMFMCHRMRLSVSPISFRLTVSLFGFIACLIYSMLIFHYPVKYKL
jgi:hypothetical protein